MLPAQELKISKDVLAAGLVIILLSLVIGLNFFAGFNLYLYLLCGAVSFAAVIARPRAGLYALVFLTFIWEKFFTLAPLVLNGQEYKFYLFDLLFCAMMVAWLIAFVSGRLELKWRAADWLLLAFIIIVSVDFLVSAFGLKTPLQPTFSSWKNYGLYALLFWLTTWLIDSREHLRRLFYFAIAGGIGILGFLAYGLYTGTGLWTEYTPLSTPGTRILAFNHAFYLSLLFLPALAYVIAKRNKLAGWLTILLPVWLIGIIGSLMRHLWIALIGGFFVMILAFGGQWRRNFYHLAQKYLWLVCGLALAVALMTTMAYYLPFSQRVATESAQLFSRVNALTLGDDSSVLWRQAVWQTAWHNYGWTGLAGAGFGQSVVINLNGYRSVVELRNMHNSWLAILLQTGVLGLVVLLLWLATLTWKVMKKKVAGDWSRLVKVSLFGLATVQAIAWLFQPYLEANFLGSFFWLTWGLIQNYGQGLID